MTNYSLMQAKCFNFYHYVLLKNYPVAAAWLLFYNLKGPAAVETSSTLKNIWWNVDA